LEAVLEDIRREKPDQVMCLGDALSPYPGSLAVWQALKDHGVRNVRGNAEEALVACADAGKSAFPDEERFRMAFLSADEIRPILDELRELPLGVAVDGTGGSRIFGCHASPAEVLRGHNLILTSGFWGYAASLPYDVVVGGHLHRFETHYVGRRLALLAGSVGLPLKGSHQAEYLILEQCQDGWQLRFKLVDYDHTAEVGRVLDTGFIANGGPLAWLSFDELLIQVDHRVPFLRDFVPTRPGESWSALVKAYLEQVGRWEIVKQFLD
jgi:predicted phosphodiesterase